MAAESEITYLIGVDAPRNDGSGSKVITPLLVFTRYVPSLANVIAVAEQLGAVSTLLHNLVLPFVLVKLPPVEADTELVWPESSAAPENAANTSNETVWPTPVAMVLEMGCGGSE